MPFERQIEVLSYSWGATNPAMPEDAFSFTAAPMDDTADAADGAHHHCSGFPLCLAVQKPSTTDSSDTVAAPYGDPDMATDDVIVDGMIIM